MGNTATLFLLIIDLQMALYSSLNDCGLLCQFPPSQFIKYPAIAPRSTNNHLHLSSFPVLLQPSTLISKAVSRIHYY